MKYEIIAFCPLWQGYVKISKAVEGSGRVVAVVVTTCPKARREEGFPTLNEAHFLLLLNKALNMSSSLYIIIGKYRENS